MDAHALALIVDQTNRSAAHLRSSLAISALGATTR